MERIKFDDMFDENNYSKKVFSQYKDDAFFKQKYNEIKKHYAQAELFEMVKAINSQRLCIDCLSLNECKQDIAGYYYDIKDTGLYKKACLKMKEIDDLNKTYRYLIYTTFDLKDKLPSLNDDIDVTVKRSKILKYIKKIISGKENKGFYLFGAPGSGKTFLMLAMLNDALEDKKRCALININDLTQYLRPLLFSNDSYDKETFDILVNKLKKVDHLYIDDIGSERVDSILRDDIVFPILDYRMQHKLFTCFTSNLPQKDLEIQYSISNKRIDEPIKGTRLLERIRVLSTEFELTEVKSRRQ
ncbi:MAG: ATP-binding protein [Bacilli bacterium]|jgi:primosomal protein DnaI|nr:ATP-binding protein [Bacilli bacterium]